MSFRFKSPSERYTSVPSSAVMCTHFQTTLDWVSDISSYSLETTDLLLLNYLLVDESSLQTHSDVLLASPRCPLALRALMKHCIWNIEIHVLILSAKLCRI